MVKPPADPSLLYSNPDNWVRTRGIALVHQETQTLLGNFSEYVHKSVGGCRKLLRESCPISVEAVEYVTGEWADVGVPVKNARFDSAIKVLTCLALEQPPLRCTEVTVNVFRQGLAIVRVELAEQTTFCGDPQAIVFQPGVDVFPHLTRETKIHLNQESLK